MKWVYLLVAIISEVMGTTALKAADGFTRPWPSLLVVAGYLNAFYFLSLTLRTIPMGVAYAIWSGIGILLVSVAGVILYKQSMDVPAMIGTALIIVGVVVLCLFSKTTVV